MLWWLTLALPHKSLKWVPFIHTVAAKCTKSSFAKKFLIDAWCCLPTPIDPKPQRPESTVERPEDQTIRMFCCRGEKPQQHLQHGGWTLGLKAMQLPPVFLVGFQPHSETPFFWKRKGKQVKRNHRGAKESTDTLIIFLSFFFPWLGQGLRVAKRH